MGVGRFTSAPLLEQNLKRCRIRSVPLCSSVIFLTLAIFYSWMFSAIGLQFALSKTIEVRYDDQCGSRASCLVDFSVPYDFTYPAALFYKLTGFSQTRRDFATSYNSAMLRGGVVDAEEVNKSCIPLIYLNDTVNPANLRIPCGLLPKYVFTDSFALLSHDAFFSDADIALAVDVGTIYQPPNSAYANASHWLLDGGLFPNEQADQHFMVWMRQAAFHPFRKLFATSKDRLRAGNYTMSIRNLYNASEFGGQKYFVITALGDFAAKKYGPALILGLMAAFFYVAAALLGWIGWRRTKTTSKFHPDQLKDIFETA
jgi:hypothetical protein